MSKVITIKLKSGEKVQMKEHKYHPHMGEIVGKVKEVKAPAVDEKEMEEAEEKPKRGRPKKS